MIDLLLFLLGIHLTTRLVAALYQIVDLGYHKAAYYPRIAVSILFWAGVLVSINLLSSPSRQIAFNSGIGAFLAFHVCIYWIGRIVMHRISRTPDEESRD